ncbi:LytR/AlgR family response regulator transcription factor [Fodinibius salsisoli]|uniref:LytTR family transcriptional regulator n=1 Tax=Fodinibius salsisoli TaxID=2820877 RepID=A0ABT3PJQ9_9BACT|nr:LytTR family DNA-binding domain-containing protein [Fodinibius salsisoli]MCW9705983.1 LytTR family transcriptional regulator [Fodinibius salsisoli]
MPDNFKTVRRQVYWFCGFWFFIAILEFGQDYISAILNGNAFIVVESLSYKLFWLLFIPLSLALNYSFTKADKFFPGLQPFVFKLILILFITSIHLILFSFILFGISNLIHEDPVTLMYLIYEKLSTRLYLALSIYFSLSVFSFVIRRIKPQGKADQKIASKTITVKNGKSSKIVDIVDIKWIASDGAYLDIHTTDKKYIVLDSLKNIIKTLPENFKRIHRSTIVNMDNIKELKSRGNGDYDVIMDDDRLLRLSRNYRKQLKGDLL